MDHVHITENRGIIQHYFYLSLKCLVTTCRWQQSNLRLLNYFNTSKWNTVFYLIHNKLGNIKYLAS